MYDKNCFVENLFEEVRDGLVLLRVCHRIDNATVDWTKPKMVPRNMFDNNHNCDMAEAAMRQIGVKMVGIGA